MTPSEKVRIKLSLTLQKPLPMPLAQIVLVELGLAGHNVGKQSLSYRDALERRNQLIKSAFDALPGRPWSRIAELSGRVISERLGDDAAGQILRSVIDAGFRIPTTVNYLATICGVAKSPKSK